MDDPLAVSARYFHKNHVRRFASSSASLRWRRFGSQVVRAEGDLPRNCQDLSDAMAQLNMVRPQGDREATKITGYSSQNIETDTT